ncbi:MAG: aminotransferase class IV [Balneolaceae bacterium]
MSEYPSKVYLNGKILHSEDAKVSVFDRGFVFGDGIYEAMVQVNGRLLLKEAHIERLNEGLKKTRIKFNSSGLDNEISLLLKESGLEKSDCLVYLQITRGIAPRKHSFPSDTSPTVMMYAKSFDLPGINPIHAHVVTVPDQRWLRCDIKMISLIGNVMANDTASSQGAYEAVLVRDGRITEGSHSNIFFVKDKVVYTHPANEFILNGITRKATLKMCEELGIEVKLEPIPENEITQMDEAFLSGTTTQIASIKQIDDHNYYANDQAGPITKKLQQAYYELKK